MLKGGIKFCTVIFRDLYLDTVLTWPMAKRLQLFGITYLVGTIKFTFFFRVHWLSETKFCSSCVSFFDLVPKDSITFKNATHVMPVANGQIIATFQTAGWSPQMVVGLVREKPLFQENAGEQ